MLTDYAAMGSESWGLGIERLKDQHLEEHQGPAYLGLCIKC